MGLWFLEVWKRNGQDVYVSLLVQNSGRGSDHSLFKEKWTSMKCSKCFCRFNILFCVFLVLTLYDHHYALLRTVIDLLSCLSILSSGWDITRQDVTCLKCDCHVPVWCLIRKKIKYSNYPSAGNTVTSSTSSNTVTSWINQMQFSDTDFRTPIADLETFGGI